MADGNIAVEVSTRAAQDELQRLRDQNATLKRDLVYARDGLTKGRTRMREDIKRLTAELAELREKVGLAYGYLWCVNNEPCAPDYMPPDRMAYEARKLLRDTMTHEERGEYINRVLPLVRGTGA